MFRLRTSSIGGIRQKQCDRRGVTRRVTVCMFAVLSPLAWLTVDGAASADVTDQASFSTSMAIQAPPFHGIEPKMVLSHDSSMGDGLLGVGWRLEGASQVTRAGRHGGVPRFDTTDRFLMDGSELVLCSPNCPSGGTHELHKRDLREFVRRQGLDALAAGRHETRV